ncbi:MAG: hypothetical protein JW894_15680 [Bacteroidales bacterium]|nr:hypothetical protein [Bacteroidales bacterium]
MGKIETYFSFLFTFYISIFNGISSDPSGAKYTVNVNNGSSLIITGFTNFGTFSCSYDINILIDTLDIEITKSDNGCLNFANLQLNLPVSNFSCGNVIMNKDFRNLLNYKEYPEIEWQILCIDISNLNNWNVLRSDTLQVNTIMKIAGEKQEYWIAVKVNKQDDRLSFSGNLPVNIRDFKLEPPHKVFGLVNVYPTINIGFSIKVNIL